MIDRMRQVGSHWGGCSWKLKFQYFSKVYLENSKSDKNGGYLHEDKCTFLIISRPFLLRMTSVSDKFCTEIQNTHFRFNKVIFCFENLAVYEIIWKESDRPLIIIWCIPFAFWIPKAKNTPSQYVILNDFTLQQWLHVHASMLRYTHIACHVTCCIRHMA